MSPVDVYRYRQEGAQLFEEQQGGCGAGVRRNGEVGEVSKGQILWAYGRMQSLLDSSRLLAGQGLGKRESMKDSPFFLGPRAKKSPFVQRVGG